MFIMKSINLIFLCSILSFTIYASPVLAKPISNTLISTVTVTNTSGDVGGGAEEDISDINAIINKTDEGKIIKVKSGEYRLDYIVNKNVTIECADATGYVDIITTQPLPIGIKIKVGQRVTVNQEGVNPVNLVWGVYQTGPGSATVLNSEAITLNVETNKEIIIKIQQQVINPLGFHDLNIYSKSNSNENIVISQRNSITGAYLTIQPDSQGIYNFGRVTDYTSDTWIKIKFSSSGIYTLELWADDGR